ncbi:LysR family transcriptional regulator [Paenibacillus tuaregi]|uniref:LysR family transcriptional regulator n=1 Tax=Paenibacillus tuaregi TaxID=1816681 RepID=UPI000838AF56|nr:LysR family transcriptional regulator [Paenibacillus tuaregi]
MDLRALKTFQLIVQHGSFIRAAEEMNYAQSTVTMQMQKLESELGVQLMERGRTIKLTEAGRLLYGQSLSIMQDMEQLEEDIAGLQKGSAGHVRIGVTEPTASFRLPELIKRFLDLYPRVRVSIEFGNTPHLSGRLLAGELDFALCSAPEVGSGLYYEPLFREEFVALIPAGHLLSAKPLLTPVDFKDHRLLITAASCPYRQRLEAAIQESGGTRPDTMEIGSMTALKYYVLSGLGVALVPRITVEPAPEGTVIRELGGTLVDMVFGLLSRSSGHFAGSAAGRLIHYLRNELGEGLPGSLPGD